jgi:hypothetical protein
MRLSSVEHKGKIRNNVMPLAYVQSFNELLSLACDSSEWVAAINPYPPI